MKLSSIIVVAVPFIFISCTQADYHKPVKVTESLLGNVYHNKEIGWSMEVPRGWASISRERADYLNEKANELVEEVHGAKNLGEPFDLISFEKDELNAFESQLSKEGPQGEYQRKLKTLNDFQVSAFRSRGFEIDTSSGREVIDGKVFNTSYTTIYFAPGKAIANQILYCCLINGYIFCVTITYDNPENKKILVDAFNNSKFSSN